MKSQRQRTKKMTTNMEVKSSHQSKTWDPVGRSFFPTQVTLVAKKEFNYNSN